MSDAAAVKQSPGAIYSAMPAIMAEVGAVEKGRKNTQQG